MHKILQISLSAALISVKLAGSANAAYTEGDISRMDELISAGNWVELRGYLLSNPALLLGDDTFVQQLRKFLESTDSLYTSLTFEQSMFPDLPDATFAQSIPVAPQAGAAPVEPGQVARAAQPQPVQPTQATRALIPSAATTSSIY